MVRTLETDKYKIETSHNFSHEAKIHPWNKLLRNEMQSMMPLNQDSTVS